LRLPCAPATDSRTADHLGSATLTTDASGNRVGELRYTPYGVTRYEWGNTPTNRRYTGQRWEGFGLYDYGARMYSPSWARFVSADVFVPDPPNPQSLNRYAYAYNNPLRYTDPSGYWVETAFDIVSLGLTLNDIRNEGFTFWNTVSLATDVASLVLPVVPAGVSHAIRAVKWANRAINAVDTAHDVANIANTAIDIERTAEIGVIGRLRGTLGEGDFGHMAAYTKIGDDIQVRGFYPQREYYSVNLFENAVPGQVVDDKKMLGQIGIPGVVKGSRTVPIETAQRLRAALGEPGPSDYFYSFNPDNFANTYNCVTWACSMVNQVLPSSPLPVVRQGRIKLAVPALMQLPSPWRVAGKIPE
jgi:RHS repeat-associated protein